MRIKAEHCSPSVVQTVKDEHLPSVTITSPRRYRNKAWLKHRPRTIVSKRKECLSSVTCVSPPIVKLETTNITSLLPQPHVDMKQLGGGHNSVAVVKGGIKVGQMFLNIETACNAVFSQQEQAGFKFRRGQTRRDTNGQIRRITLRCHQYGEYKPCHEKDIDPADFRVGKSAKTECMAHVNLCQDGSLWRISLVDLVHNHGRYLPIGGSASRPPTEEQRKLVSGLATANTKFSRAHISSLLNTQSVGHPLEPRQIGNIINSSRKEARDEVKRLGGDIHAIIRSLEEKNRTDPGWRYHLKVDPETSTVMAVFWQSPIQVELARRFGDVIINDNSYNKVDCQYPLNTGVIVDGHNGSRNIWYCFHRSEDADTFTWVLNCYLGDEDLGDAIDAPEVFISDRHPSLVASVVVTLPTSFHVYCLYHMDGNIYDNLRLALGAEWVNFTRDFWATYRAISPEEFDRLWKHLIACYPSSKNYLEAQLYPCRSQWAWAWISMCFMAGIHTSGRSECEHWILKTIGGPKKTLFQVFNGLNEHTNVQAIQDTRRVCDVCFI